MKKRLRVWVVVGGSIMALCIITAGISALSNRNLPTGPEMTDRLDVLDKARLAETLHLKQELGENVWPGWGKADIPVLLWNRDYAFLVGYAEPPSGWEPVAGESFQEQPYFRQPADNPQNFAVRIGDRWVASMATKWETDAFVIEMIRGVLPALVEPVVPYRLLIQPSELQISAVLHESFHVYQAQITPERLEKAEQAHRLGDQYWETDAGMRADWKQEIDLLAKALKTKSDSEAAALVRQFLAQRERRRTTHDLDPALIDYERQLEWEEGLAKYVELAIWREANLAQAGDGTGYQPLSSMASDPDFREYTTYKRRWSQEIAQMKRQATREGEPRFYYTGMAQAMLLDRLQPGWQDHVLSDDVWLDMLLDKATE